MKLNYSGVWSVKDAWESGGWEPRADQLSWQRYELAAAITSSVQAASEQASSKRFMEEENTVPTPASTTVASRPAELENSRNIQAVPSAATVARNLTTQVVDRQFPIITSPSVNRDFLYRLSQIPWTEQRMIKQSFDSSINPKKIKRLERTTDPFKNTTLPSKLSLKQVAKSVKYVKNKVRNVANKEKKAETSEEIVRTLSGEWENEHSFLCSVCGIEYDDVLEIMHHKWEAHPHCLVAHVSLRQNLQRPPALLYPQASNFTSVPVVYN